MIQKPSALNLRAMWKYGLILGVAGAMIACGPITPSPNPNNTGGAGITAHEDHSSRIQSASGTGSSEAAFGTGAVPGSGASGELDNAHSPTESNGGRPLPVANASRQTANSGGDNGNAPAADATAPASSNGASK